MRSVAEALVVVAFGFEQLAEVGLAVYIAVQGGVVAQAGKYRAACNVYETVTNE